MEAADLVILATPIEHMLPIVEQLPPLISPHTIITDVGSLKHGIHQQIHPILKNQWCGSHPMAGSEKTGFLAADPDLFLGATTIITPASQTPPHVMDKLTAFWEFLGSKTRKLSPARHDALVAQISHFPHLIAALLVHITSDDALPIIGPGFRDTTRVAAGPADLWQSILSENRENVINSIDDLSEVLKHTRNLLAENSPSSLESLHTILASASERRQKVKSTA